jgi:putative membrane protein
MSDSERRPRPRAFRLNGDETVTSKPAPQVEPEVDIFAEAVELADAAQGGEEAVEAARAKGFLDRYIFSSSGVFLSAVSGLVTLALSVWIWNFVEDLFARSAILGTIGLALAAAAAFTALLFVAREIRAILQQNRVARLHADLAAARVADDVNAARTRVLDLCKLYESRAELARPRALVADYVKQIIDGKDLVDLAERSLVAPLDELAR